MIDNAIATNIGLSNPLPSLHIVITGLVPVIHVDGRVKPCHDGLGKQTPHGRNKHQSREKRAKVRKVLMQEWDPIGVRGVAEAQDEYDSYLGRVYVMLMDERASVEAIADYLYRTATEYMGISPGSWLVERSAQAARSLVRLRPSFELY